MEFFEVFALELRIVHLSKHIDEFLEIVAAFLIVFKCEVLVANSQYETKHIFLPFHRSYAVDCIECILLQDYEIYKF